MSSVQIPCSNDYLDPNIFTVNVVGSLSLIFNSIVIFLSMRQSTELRMYSKLIILSSVCNINVSLVRIIVGLKPTFVQGHLVYFTLSPIFYNSSNKAQEWAIVVSFLMIFTQSTIPTVQFFYRYRIIKESFVSQATLMTAFGVLFLYNFLDAITFLVIFEGNPKNFDYLLFDNMITDCKGLAFPTYTVIVSAKSLSFWHNAMTNIGTLGSFVGVAYYGVKTWMQYNQNSVNMVLRRRRLNRQLTTMLVLQTVPPLFFNIVPVLMFNSHMFSNKALDFTTIALTIGPTFTPLFDAFTVIFILPSFRRKFIGLLQCKVPKLSTVTIISTSVKKPI